VSAETRFEFTVTVDPGVPNGGPCRLHGRRCTIPWGWDPAHTDSPRPYTLEELETRQECPHFYAYPDEQAYLLGWHIWRQMHRDGELNEAEAAVRWAGIECQLKALLAKQQARSGW